MADFLSAEWLAALNGDLREAGPPPIDEGANTIRIVFELTDAPSSMPHAITFTVTPGGASVEVGDHLGADAVIRIDYRDGQALTKGTLTSADAVRDGRFKIRGDVQGLRPLLSWILGAHAG